MTMPQWERIEKGRFTDFSLSLPDRDGNRWRAEATVRRAEYGHGRVVRVWLERQRNEDDWTIHGIAIADVLDHGSLAFRNDIPLAKETIETVLGVLPGAFDELSALLSLVSL